MSNGALLDQMRVDNRSILGEGGFQTPLTITTRGNITPEVTAIIDGTITLHNTQIDPETGTYASIRTAHCVFNTQELIDAGFPVYGNGKIENEPDMKNSKISFVDATGKTHYFKAAEPRPSHTFGCISVILSGAKA